MININCDKEYALNIFQGTIQEDKIRQLDSDKLTICIGKREDVEAKTSKISRQMQKFYYGALLPQIIEFNKETGIIVDSQTEMEITDIDAMDYFLRYFFYYSMQQVNDVEFRIPKTLKLTKAERPAVCNYFNMLIIYMAKKGLVIKTPEDDWWNELLEKYNS